MAKKSPYARLENRYCAVYKGWGTAMFVLGFLFLLKDIGLLTLGGVQPWTIAFLCLGVYLLFTKCVEPM
ncbi:MAG: hypothetical protein ACE5DM_01685 [Candidatus Nanoarchaeia archaeon]